MSSFDIPRFRWEYFDFLNPIRSVARSSLAVELRANDTDGEDFSAFNGQYYITETKALKKLQEPVETELD